MWRLRKAGSPFSGSEWARRARRVRGREARRRREGNGKSHWSRLASLRVYSLVLSRIALPRPYRTGPDRPEEAGEPPKPNQKMELLSLSDLCELDAGPGGYDQGMNDMYALRIASCGLRVAGYEENRWADGPPGDNPLLWRPSERPTTELD